MPFRVVDLTRVPKVTEDDRVTGILATMGSSSGVNQVDFGGVGDSNILKVLTGRLDGKWCIFATEEVRQDIQFPVADGDVNGSNGAESGETTSVVAGVSMVDASKIASIAVTNGNTGEQKIVTGKKAYSDEYLA